MLLSVGAANAQSLVEDANPTTNVDGTAGLFSETIKIISGSKKIFVITNNNQQLSPGDFISLALENKLAARALVAKTHQGQAGIKILKIYSMAQWSKLRRDLDVQIVKGDDSTFGKAAAPATEAAQTGPKIETEDDLYTKDVVVADEDDIEVLEENKNRNIRTDNILAVTGAFFEATEVEPKEGTVRTNEWGLSWAYQISDNYFVEGLYGRALLDNYPREGSQTLVNHLTGRIKYNFKGPLYTFFMPYIGFHTYTVSSPDAGKSDNMLANDRENEAIDNLQKSGPVFGVTILRRLVPGWFIKADIGSDIINAGFAIEF